MGRETSTAHRSRRCTRPRRGYATALVAALSQHLLDAGCAYTSLFTDLANPISNDIYPRVGYRAVSDARYVRVFARGPARRA